MSKRRKVYISTLDLEHGYWQVPLSASASRCAVFVILVGTFRALVLKHAPFSFSKSMEVVLRGMGGFALPYLDDVAIFHDTLEEHIVYLRSVFNMLRKAQLTMKAKKCNLG